MKDTKGISAAATAAVLVVAFVVIFGIYYESTQGTKTSTTTSSTPPSGSTPPPSGAGSQSFPGTDLSATAYNALSTGTTYTLGTNLNVLWYTGTCQPGNIASCTYLTTNTATTKSIKTNNGNLYAAVSIPSGQNYYVDAIDTATSSHNLDQGWSTAVQYFAIQGGSTTNYFVFQYNLADITGGTSTTDASTSLHVALIPSLTPTATACSCNVTGFGKTASNTTTFALKGSLPTANAGVMLTEVTIKFNVTAADPIYLAGSSINVPTNAVEKSGTSTPGSVSLTSFSCPTPSGTNYVCTYYLGTGTTGSSTDMYDNGQFVEYQSGSTTLTSTPSFSLALQANFAANGGPGSDLAITVTVTYVTAADNTASLSWVVGVHG